MHNKCTINVQKQKKIKMLKFRDFLMDTDKIENEINEMAFGKIKDIEHRIEGLSDPITKHLIKILYFEDTVNLRKHISDIDKWFLKIQEYDYQKANKKLKSERYFNKLFKEPITSKENVKYVENSLKRQLKEYKSLPRTGLSSKEVLEKIYLIIIEVSEELSKDSFETIENKYNKER